MVKAVGDKATIYRWVLITVFVIGFLLVVLAKAIKFGLVDSPSVAWVEMTVDLIFELGVALWAGVSTPEISLGLWTRAEIATCAGSLECFVGLGFWRSKKWGMRQDIGSSTGVRPTATTAIFAALSSRPSGIAILQLATM